MIFTKAEGDISLRKHGFLGNGIYIYIYIYICHSQFATLCAIAAYALFSACTIHFYTCACTSITLAQQRGQNVFLWPISGPFHGLSQPRTASADHKQFHHLAYSSPSDIQVHNAKDYSAPGKASFCILRDRQKCQWTVKVDSASFENEWHIEGYSLLRHAAHIS